MGFCGLLRRWLLPGVLLGNAVACSAPGAGEEIVMAAAASLTDSLREIAVLYEAQSSHRIVFNFGASSILARQIDEGAPAHVFFSADVEKMEYLTRRERIEPGSQVHLLSNVLVIVVPADSDSIIRSPKDLLHDRVTKIAVAEPSSVPAGAYAREYLQREGLWEQIRRKVIPVRDVRAALAAVEAGNVDAGFVYRTDAATSMKTKVTYEVPREAGPKIIYPLGLVKGKNKKAARDFVKFLLTPRSKDIFRKHGFLVLE